MVLLSIFSGVVLYASQLFRQWLMNQYDPLAGKNILVFDADGDTVGRVIGFDSVSQAPLIALPYQHVVPSPTDPNRVATTRAILGVRNTAGPNGSASFPPFSFFSSQQAVFYSGYGCSGATKWVLNPYNARAPQDGYEAYDHDASVRPLTSTIAVSVLDNAGPDPVAHTHPASTTATFGPHNTPNATPRLDARQLWHDVDSFATLQGFVYAIGFDCQTPGVNCDSNLLYRAAVSMPPAVPGATDPRPLSVFVSRSFTSGARCIDLVDNPGTNDATLPDPDADRFRYDANADGDTNDPGEWDLRPENWTLVVATLVDDLDDVAAPDVYTFRTHAGVDLGGAYTGFWVPVATQTTHMDTAGDTANATAHEPTGGPGSEGEGPPANFTDLTGVTETSLGPP